jgi:GAF domain-containing protein
MKPERQTAAFDALVELADTLVGDYDVAEFLQLLIHRCAELLQADAAGVLLESPDGHLQLVAAVSDEMRAIEELEIRTGEGPSTAAYQRGQPVIAEDLRDFEEQWPQVVPRLLAMGMHSAHGFPMRLRDHCVGAINVYRSEAGHFSDEDRRLGQVLADIATIGILQERKVAAAELVTEQLQLALESRVVIEQAKGMLAERHDITALEAFEVMRRHARERNRRLRDVCQDIIDGTGPARPR